MKDSTGINPESKEYKLGCAAAAVMRERTNNALGDILTLIEATMGETAQSKALKQLVKQTFWSLADDNQHTVYYAFGQEPRKTGDTFYIEAVLSGTDEQSSVTSPADLGNK